MMRMLLFASVVVASTNLVAAQDESEHVCPAKSDKGSVLTKVVVFITTERPDQVALCQYADESTTELVRGKCGLATADLYGHGVRRPDSASGFHECNADANDPRRCRVLCRAPS